MQLFAYPVVLEGQPTPGLELAPQLVRKTQHSYYNKASTVLKNTVELFRYLRNVRRIIKSPEGEGIKFMTWRGRLRTILNRRSDPSDQHGTEGDLSAREVS